MVLLNASGLKKMFLDETLFQNVSFQIAEGDKIGFIGANGAGKSTLFKILNETMEYDSGELYKNRLLRIGYLDQYSCTDSNNTVMDEILGAFSDVIAIENELSDIRFEIESGSGDTDALIMRQTTLTERFEALDGYQYKSRATSALTGLGFSEAEFSRCVSELSGGEKTRVALGRLLLSDANLLLLDEPTNHLDIESVEWLEGFLNAYRGSFVIISHDRYFLDKVTNRTFELSGGRLRAYSGGYSDYVKMRETERKTEERSYRNTMREIERLQGIVEQQRRWNREKNIKTAESKQKVIDKLEGTLNVPDRDNKDIKFSFVSAPGGGQDVLMLEGVGMSFGDKRVFSGCDAHIVKGERVFLLGANGCGKTTLIKNIIGEYAPTEGEIRIGANIKIGYYDQIQENLDPEKTVFDELHDTYPNMTETEIRNALAVFLFRGEYVFREIKKLSGGERARVELAKLMLRPVNFLIMDEPTNHLDIDSREALETALADYDGTVLMVSHDRYFINKLADRVLGMTSEGLINSIGGYDDYTEFKSRLKTEKAPVAEKTGGNADYKEQKRIQAEKRRVLNRFKKVEELIEEIESETELLNEEMSKPENASDFSKLAELSDRAAQKQRELDTLMEEWEELDREIEEKGYDDN